MHFTYSEAPQKELLCQGDILERTEKLLSVLSEHHPYFINSQYKYFIVITQTCDLVRRNKNDCNSPYITLAAVRSYEDFIDRSCEKYDVISTNGFRLLGTEKYIGFFQLLERLFNNNEPGYFFIAKEETQGIDEHMVAFLKVSIALKSELHYDTCLAAKRVELSDEFKAKLGWLVGSMYSKVGTKDWFSLMPRKIFQSMIKDELKDRFIIDHILKLEQLKTIIEKDNLQNEDIGIVRQRLRDIAIPGKYEQLIDELRRIMSLRADFITDDDKETLMRYIESSTEIQSIINSKA